MTGMNTSEDLAIVIPVWNLPEDLSALLEQVAESGLFSEVVVSDDGSEPPCDPRALGFDETQLGGARLVYLRSSEQRGAGHARNRGLEAVTARNVLFFDADDRLEPGLQEIWETHVAEGTPDFTIFRHIDTRVLEGEQREGSFAPEEKLWNRALGRAETGFLSVESRAHLSALSAYPWNKIYRTSFLRDAGIQCSETPVHNDIRLHWLSFLRADRVLASRVVGATHVVGNRGHHLTTRRGEDRLCLEDILDKLTKDIRATPNRMIMMRHFIHFTHNVCRWNLEVVDEALVPRFAELARKAYLSFTPEEFGIYARWQPERANSIVQFLMAQGV